MLASRRVACTGRKPVALPMRRLAPVTTRARQGIKAAAAMTDETLLQNPFFNSEIQVLNMKNQEVPLGQVTEGKTVVSLLRHLGCPWCWDHARTMLAMKPQIEAMGFKLVILSMGEPVNGGKTFCKELPFPEELLFLDPTQAVYKQLSLYSMNMFMGMDFVNATMDGMQKNKNLMDTLGRYKLIQPPNPEIVLQLGGTYVVVGDKLLLGHMEKGVGSHADTADILRAVATGVKM